jgi:hypothetical protein
MLTIDSMSFDPRSVAMAEFEKDGSVATAELQHADGIAAAEPGIDLGKDSPDAIDQFGMPATSKGEFRPVLGIPNHRRWL